VLESLKAEFGDMFDPCPPNPQFDGLAIDWHQVNFINPPYGRETVKWIKKGYEESLQGRTCIFLIPSRTDTVWWHEYVMKAGEIRFIRGRLKFGGAVNSAPFPSAIVIFGGSRK
jgi:site-specific DNA-methyltransferase (adenine-specific)